MSLINQMYTRGRLNSGQELEYAFALNLSRYKGLNVVEHGGALGGYRAALTRFPDQRFSVACLCNLETTDPEELANHVAEIYLADQFKQAASMAPAESKTDTATPEAPVERAAPPPAAPSPIQLAEYVGKYFSEELNVTYTLKLDGDKLCYQLPRRSQMSLSPKGKDTFVAEELQFNFLRDLQQRLSGFTVTAGRVKNLRFVKRGD